MIKVYLENKTGNPIFVTGQEGSDWDSVTTNGVAPGGFAQVGTMTEATSAASDHWGWIFIGLHNAQKSTLQLYLADGTSRGVFDYAVQYYDGGKNRTGGTIAQTQVDKRAGGVVFTVEHTFDPWMSNIPDDRKLHQITIPGTHDSGTLGLLAPSECQSTTLEAQLMMGVRYFDIRVDSSNSNLRVVHGEAQGSGNTDLYFKDVAETFRDFLLGKRGYPSTNETVILQVKSDRGSESGMHTAVSNILSTAFAGQTKHLYRKPIRLNGDIPTIKDLRGKLVLMRRYDYNLPNNVLSGTCVKYFASGTNYNAWSQNPGTQTWLDKFTADNFEWPGADDNKSYFKGTLIDYRNPQGLSFVIQDKYENYGSYTDKFNLVRQYLNSASQAESPDSWFINFASCSSPGNSSAVINPLLANYFANPPTPKAGCGFGTVMMDYVQPALVRSIIAANF